jgi:drug/metabolite transporter (DMT)-like permease
VPGDHTDPGAGPVALPDPTEGPPRSGDLALLVAAVCFGSTFLIVQDAVALVEPVPFLAVRFALGAMVLWPLARRRPGSPGELRDGLLAGAALLAGYVLQTVGLQYTSSATSAFITYLLVVFVPVLGFVLLGRRPHPVTAVGIAIAVTGLVLLTDPGGGGPGFGRGELLTLGCAVAFAGHVLVLGETAHRHDPIRLAAIQVAVVAAGCALPGVWMGGYRFPAPAWTAAVATGLFATGLAFVLQVTGQRTVPAARAALILLLEPVFAGVLAGITGDPLSAVQLVGAATILGAVALSELLPGWLDRRRRLGEAASDNDRSRRAGSGPASGHTPGGSVG